FDPAQGHSALGGDALQQVAVGGKVVGVQDDLAASWPCIDRCANELVEDDRGRVADERLAWCGAERGLAEGVSDAQRQRHPLLVPAADEPAAPGFCDEAAHPID